MKPIHFDIVFNKSPLFLNHQIPIVDDEMKRAAGDTKDEDTAMTQGGSTQRLVTADGTYATQSAFSSTATTKKPQDR